MVREAGQLIHPRMTAREYLEDQRPPDGRTGRALKSVMHVLSLC